MLELKNKNSAEEIFKNRQIDLYLYEYVKAIFVKTEEILEEDAIQVNIDDNHENTCYQQFKLKWQREIKICNIKYIESFKTNETKGIIFLNKIN